MDSEIKDKKEGNKFLGKVLDSRYAVESLIEVGGMGSVYEGTHLKLGRKIAIKILHEEFLADEVQMARFLREARAASEIHHRNVVDIIDIGTTNNGLPYFVMELLQGESLKVRIKKKKILEPSEIAWIIQQALAGLSVAHENGIIHRDVKPGNIFICKEKDGEEIVKILDFGVAKLKFHKQDFPEKELTTTGMVIGTPYYMSPEQAMGKKHLVDARSDIYSCGLIVYRALTGKHPFIGDNYNEIIFNILSKEVPPPSYVNRKLSKEIDEVVMKAISRDREERYSSCRDFIKALEVLRNYKVEKSNGGSLDEKPDSTDGQKDIESNKENFMEEKDSSSLLLKNEKPKPGEFLKNDIFAGKVFQHHFKLRKWFFLLILITVSIGIMLIYHNRNHNRLTRISENKQKNLNSTNTVAETVQKEKQKNKDNSSLKQNIELSIEGLPDGTEVFIDNRLHTEKPVFIEKGENPVLVEVKKEGILLFKKSIIPDSNSKIIIPVPDKSESLIVEKTPLHGMDEKVAMEDNKDEKKEKRGKKNKKKDAMLYTKIPVK